MSRLRLRWKDVEGLRRFESALEALGDKRMRTVLVRAVNRAGAQARTQTVRALRRQTGLKRRTLHAAVRPIHASRTDLAYLLTAQGGDVSLRYFAARETRRGVSAAPWGKREIFASTFMKGGVFPDRVRLKMGGHVFAREGRGRQPIVKVKSGVVIPAEMVKGASADAFRETGGRVLVKRVAHELGRITKGAVT